MPLCARCTGFYGGLPAGLPFGWLLSLYTHLPLVPMFLVLGLGVFPMFVDGFTQHMGWRESTNSMRLGTGLLAGGTISMVLTELLLYGSGA